MFSIFPKVTAKVLFTLCLGYDHCENLHLTVFRFCLYCKELGNVVILLTSELLRLHASLLLCHPQGQTVLLSGLQKFVILSRYIS